MNATITSSLPATGTRVSSIDIARGVVMIVMALDHARHFFDGDSMLYEPTDLSRTTPILFFTRWITHYCAPSFVLLAGVSIRMSSVKKNKSELRTFLLTRGIWLIFLELVVVRFLVLFNFYYDFTIVQVIWAIGAAMVVMALLIRLNDLILLSLSLLIICGHNLLQNISIESGSIFYVPSTLLFRPGTINVGESSFLVTYPVMQWLGIMMLGFVLGKWYHRDYDPVRRTYLLGTGMAMILTFVIVRYLNIYGDTDPWQVHDSFIFTVMSFVNCQKYPPSFLFTMMTLGPLFVTLGLLEGRRLSFLKPVQIFGRVPMFYYLLHFLFIHAAAIGYFMIKTGKSFSEIDFHKASSFGGITPEIGHSVLAVYVATILVVLLLYPLCKWYNRYKSERTGWWYSYI